MSPSTPPARRLELPHGLEDIPHHNEDADVEPAHPAVRRPRATLGTADTVLPSTPEYNASLPVALELLSALSYVVIFRSVFCAGMRWRLSYQIGMSEQAANSLLPASGAGGLAVATVLQHLPLRPSGVTRSNRVTSALRLLRHSVAEGVRDALVVLRRRPLAVIGGSLGTMGFDLAVLGVCFRAFGASPPIGVLALGYLIGQLGGNLPLPGGLGGIEGGLVGTFALYHQPFASTTAAVLAYHAISRWIPALLGSAAFVKLRKILAQEDHPASICAPAPGPARPVAQPVPAR